MRFPKPAPRLRPARSSASRLRRAPARTDSRDTSAEIFASEGSETGDVRTRSAVAGVAVSAQSARATLRLSVCSAASSALSGPRNSASSVIRLAWPEAAPRAVSRSAKCRQLLFGLRKIVGAPEGVQRGFGALQRAPRRPRSVALDDRCFVVDDLAAEGRQLLADRRDIGRGELASTYFAS